MITVNFVFILFVHKKKALESEIRKQKNKSICRALGTCYITAFLSSPLLSLRAAINRLAHMHMHAENPCAQERITSVYHLFCVYIYFEVYSFPMYDRQDLI